MKKQGQRSATSHKKALSGRVAIITGASQGFGKAMALALGRAGAKLALVSRDRQKLDKVAATIRRSGGEAKVFPADVRSEDQVRQIENDIVQTFGRVHILINNAGINIRKPLTEFTLEEWNRVMETNVTSVFLMCRSFVPHMKGNGYGRIINMASMMSWVSLPGRAPYTASKSALLGITRTLALELANEAITVNAITAGLFPTEFSRPVLDDPQASQQWLSKIPLGRWGRVEEIGQLALYLCSEEAGFITGTDVLIDGGWCAQ